MKKLSSKIITAAQMGDIYAINEIIERYSSLAYYHSIKYLKNSHDAKDCAQEAVEKIIKNLHMYDSSISSFDTWTYRIIDNTAINYYRAISKHTSRFISDDEYIYNYCSTEEVSKDFEWMISDLEKHLSELSYKILIYKTIYNYKFTDISKIFNISIDKAKKTYYAAVKEAKAYLKGNYEETTKRCN